MIVVNFISRIASSSPLFFLLHRIRPVCLLSFRVLPSRRAPFMMVTFHLWALVPFLSAVFAVIATAEENPPSLEELIKNSGLDFNDPVTLEAVSLAEAYEASQQPAIETIKPKGTTSGAADAASSRSAMNFMSMIHRSGWFGTLMKKAKMHFKDKCLRLKMEGHTPEAMDSPLEKFGYVRFDIEFRKHTISPGLTLTKFGRWLVPIRVGTEDYTIQGNSGSMLVFLDCFSDYEVRGARLTGEGEWDESQQTESPLFLQLENVGPEAFGSVKYMMYTHSVDQLLKSIDPMAGFAKTIWKPLEIVPAVAPAIKKSLVVAAGKWLWIKHLYQLAGTLDLSQEEVGEVWNDLAGQQTFSARIKRFLQLLRKSREHMAREEWSGYQNVKMKKPVTLTITMYPKPEHGVRATYALRSNRVKVAEVFKAVAKLLTATGTAEKLSDVNGIFDE